MSYTRNRAVTTQCGTEVRIATDGWSAWRDADCLSTTASCPLDFSTALADAGTTTALTGDLATTSGVQRLVFTPRGRLYRLTGGGNCVDLSGATPVAAGTTLTLVPSATLRIDGATGYASLQ